MLEDAGTLQVCVDSTSSDFGDDIELMLSYDDGTAKGDEQKSSFAFTCHRTSRDWKLIPKLCELMTQFWKTHHNAK